jgi:hypothetical protein
MPVRCCLGTPPCCSGYLRPRGRSPRTRVRGVRRTRVLRAYSRPRRHRGRRVDGARVGLADDINDARGPRSAPDSASPARPPSSSGAAQAAQREGSKRQPGLWPDKRQRAAEAVPIACPIGRSMTVFQGHSQCHRTCPDLDRSNSGGCDPQPSKLVLFRIAEEAGYKDPRQGCGNGRSQRSTASPAGGRLGHAYCSRMALAASSLLTVGIGLDAAPVMALRARSAVAVIWVADAPGGLQ